MDTILANAAQLNNILLDTDEEEYDNIALQVHQALRKLPIKEGSQALQTLQQIDPRTYTIPYVFLLSTLIDAAVSATKGSRSLPQSVLPEGNLWPLITNALLSFDAIQVRYVGVQFSKIVEVVYHGADQTSNYVPAMQLLQNAILRLDPTSSTLSITHFYFVKLCLYARAYAEATFIIDRPVYHVPTSESTKTLEGRLSKYPCSVQESSLGYINPQTGLSGKITTRIYLEYFLMGALCYIGTEQLRKAQAFLEIVLVTPSQQNVASLIMLEAYRKWLLVGLLIDGNGSQPPRSMNGNALKHIRILAKPYECVVDAFKTNKQDILRAEIQEGLEQWRQDGNYGLMSEVFQAFRKFAVVRLSKTFAALSVEEVAQRTSSDPADPQETLTYVQDLITTGSLQAQILPATRSGSIGTVRFLPPTAAQKPEAQVEQELAIKTVELKTLLKHISDYDHQLEVNRDYLEWLQKAKKARDQEKKLGQAGGTKPLSGPPGPAMLDDEEDMMEEW